MCKKCSTSTALVYCMHRYLDIWMGVFSITESGLLCLCRPCPGTPTRTHINSVVTTRLDATGATLCVLMRIMMVYRTLTCRQNVSEFKPYAFISDIRSVNKTIFHLIKINVASSWSNPMRSHLNSFESWQESITKVCISLVMSLSNRSQPRISSR